MSLLKSFIVKGGNNCLTNSGRSMDQIFIMSINFSFRRKLVKNFLLVSIWPDLYQEPTVSPRMERCFRQFLTKLLTTLRIVRVKGLKGCIVPVAFKGYGKLPNNIKGFLLCDLHVPF